MSAGVPTMIRRRFVLLAASVLACAVCAWSLAPAIQSVRAAAESLPARLSDHEFWKLVAEFSEPNGSFRSDNLLSNELWMQHVIPDLVRTTKPGRAYMGVGPEQNFTYIAAVRPKLAFIVDVRRGNRDLHLMYKALFELSADRAEFVSRLFSKKRPTGLSTTSTVTETFAAYTNLEDSDLLRDDNPRTTVNRLGK